MTWEILEKSEVQDGRTLRLVKAAELHAATLLEEAEANMTGSSTPLVDEDDGILTTEKSNVNIFDDPSNQKLTMGEIEALKNDEVGGAKEIIAKIMASHSTIDQKTAFSLAKYMVRKQKKYMKRFTVTLLDVAMLADWMMSEREFAKILEIRNETLGLMGSWANIHAAAAKLTQTTEDDTDEQECRYLVVDDTGGLVVAEMAERMGILHHDILKAPSPEDDNEEPEEPISSTKETPDIKSNTIRTKVHQQRKLASSNTLTLIHSNSQPNLALLRYFNFDANIVPSMHDPNPVHPLHTHLRTLSWLQLLEPESDSTCIEPPAKTLEELQAMKSNARSTYHRKRRRWSRCKDIVDETRAGNFNGLIVASYTDPTSILHQLVPLLAGGAQIVVYSPHVEPLNTLIDAYSTARRSAYLNLSIAEREAIVPSAEFPVDPTLTLGFMLQTARVRKWQVLPGRTHPLMTGRGGAEGYVAVATRVLPVKGEIRARGKQMRSNRRKQTENEMDAVPEKAGDRDEERNSSSADEGENGNKKMRVEQADQEDVDMISDEVDVEVSNTPDLRPES